ncbi:hypothetical protein GCM10027610_082790 [Dactylosporangium cerinum]
MWEGHVVHAMRHPVTVTKDSDGPPQFIGIRAGTLDIGGAQVPTSQTIMWHPGMVVTDAGAGPEASPEAKRYAIRPPDGERFLAWSPDHLQSPAGQNPAATARWDLSDIPGQVGATTVAESSVGRPGRLRAMISRAVDLVTALVRRDP